MDVYNIGEIYSQCTPSFLPVAEPIIPILHFISVIHCSSSSSSSSISTGSGSKGGIFVISLLSIPYLRNTSLNSFLVLYEENDLNFLSLHSLANFTSLLAGPPGIPHFSSSSWVKSKKSWPLISSSSKILIAVSLRPKFWLFKNETSPSVSYFLT